MGSASCKAGCSLARPFRNGGDGGLVEHRGGAVLATSGLVVANENLGGDYFAYLVSALGGFAVFAGVLGTHGARGENGWCVVRRPSFLFFSAGLMHSLSPRVAFQDAAALRAADARSHHRAGLLL